MENSPLLQHVSKNDTQKISFIEAIVLAVRQSIS